jgi:hypothetical protein
MDTQDPDQKAADTPEPKPDEAATTKPRGNPETDHESVRKGEEQLEKVSGN